LDTTVMVTHFCQLSRVRAPHWLHRVERGAFQLGYPRATFHRRWPVNWMRISCTRVLACFLRKHAWMTRF